MRIEELISVVKACREDSNVVPVINYRMHGPLRVIEESLGLEDFIEFLEAAHRHEPPKYMEQK